MSPQFNTLPVNLLLTDHPCLVAGGGKVALRKTGHLLEAGACVTVVAPKICEAFAALDVVCVERAFKLPDINGKTLVFACTNDRQVNRLILDECRKNNVLCSCVDGHWAQSDFTTPAISRHGSLTLAVSTGGQSCRQAKLIKDNLAKHIELVESADLVVVGTDHHHMDIEEREPYHLIGSRFERIGWMITQLWGIHEFIILNTCNRIELIAVASHETSTNGILRHLLGFDKLKEDKFYLKCGADAFEHLCMVSAGMLSQTPGETHIAAQLKDALETARQRGWANSMMQEWVSSLLHVSKHIQTDVAPLLRNEEIETLALNYLQAHDPDFAEKTILILGAGQVGQGLVKECFPMVGKILWCYHKNKPDFSNDWKNVEFCTFNDFKDRLAEVDIIISATDAPGYVLHHGHAPFFNQQKPVCLIDLGMPRNIEPKLDELSEELHVVDLDGLKYWHRREGPELDDIFHRCHGIIAEHQEQYERTIKSFQGGNAQ